MTDTSKITRQLASHNAGHAFATELLKPMISATNEKRSIRDEAEFDAMTALAGPVGEALLGFTPEPVGAANDVKTAESCLSRFDDVSDLATRVASLQDRVRALMRRYSTIFERVVDEHVQTGKDLKSIIAVRLHSEPL